MVDYWSVVVDCSRSKAKGLNPLQIYNMKQALSSILTIICSTLFRKMGLPTPTRLSQNHKITKSQGVGVCDKCDRCDSGVSAGVKVLKG